MKNALLILSLFAALVLRAQQECGTVVPAGYSQQLQQRIANLPAQGFERGGMIMVPVHIHLIRQSDGTSNITLQDVQSELDSVNDFYANAGLQFFECLPAEMIDDDSLYDFEYATEEAVVFSNHYSLDVINLYFANSVSMSSTPVCGYAYFPGGADASFISSACLNGSTTAHELGHYFGLLHTHGGSSDELVDGSNCSFEGDYICDTPADPGLSNSVVDSSCVYSGTSLDLNGMLYTPDVHNIMSYSRKLCRNSFTPTQYSVIYNTWLADRQYLNCVITSTHDVDANGAFVLFPNPSSGTVTLHCDLDAQLLAQAELKIISLEGKLVKTIARGTLEDGATISLGDLAPGMYFYSLLSGGEVLFAGKAALVR